LTKAILQTKVDQIFLVEVTVEELEYYQSLGKTITQHRVKIIGYNPDGAKIPVNLKQGADFTNWTIDDLEWINPNDPRTVGLFEGIEDLQIEFEGLRFEIAAVETEVTTPPVLEIKENMVSLSLAPFTKIDGRIKGEVLAITEQSFPAELYGKKINLFVQLVEADGKAVIIKQNDLFFTQTERDERILIDEFADPTIKFAQVFAMYENSGIALPKQIAVLEEGDEAPDIPPPVIPPTERKEGNQLFNKAKGVIALLTALSILGSGVKS